MVGGRGGRRQRPGPCGRAILIMMKRWLLPLTTLTLALLVLVDRIGHLRAGASPEAVAEAGSLRLPAVGSVSYSMIGSPTATVLPSG